MRTKLLASLAATVTTGVLATTGYWMISEHTSSTAADTARLASKASARVEAPRAPAISRAGWAVGSEYVHRLTYRMRFGGTSDGPTAQELKFSSTCTTLVVAHDDASIDVQVRLTDTHTEVAEATTESAMAEAMPAATSPEFYVTYDRSGRATKIHFPKAVPAGTRPLLRQLIGTLQFSAPNGAEAQWTALESDAAGEYQAQYRATGSGKYLRTKSKYLRLLTPKGLMPASSSAPLIKLGESQFELDEAGRLQRLAHRSLESTPVNDVGLALETETELTVELVRKGHRTDVLAMPSDGLDSAILAADSGELAVASDNADRNLVAGAKLSELVAELVAARASGDQNALFYAQNRLSALLRLEPGLATQLARGLEAGDAPAILGALGFSGTPEAQQALAGIMSDARTDKEVRVAAIDSMLTVERPSLEVRTALAKIVESGDPALVTNASYMLGVAANRLQEADPEAARVIVDQMTEELGTTSDNQQKVRILESLGNAGSSDALASIEQGLASPDERVRDASARALRFVQDSKADVLLGKVLTIDPSAVVRQGALFAAGYRAYAPLAAALKVVCEKDANAIVRSSAVAALAEQAKSDGEALMLLDWMAQHDPDAAIRDQAKKVVQRPPS